MGKNKRKNYNKQMLSNFSRTGNLNKGMIDDLDDDFNEIRYATGKRRKL